MTESASNSRRLAKNTVVLYIRTFVTMVIGFFTSRVLLNSLGIDNYGIYNVVGGFVAMFSIVTGTLTATTQRYLTFELGKNSSGNPRKVFGAALCIHIALALLMVVIFESLGLWFLNTQLNIPDDRMFAANWVFQLSVLCSVLGLFSTPYNAVIVAHEHMKAFAYIGLQDTVLKLIICYLLYVSPFDKLIVYGILLSMVMFWNQFLYVFYCRRHFKEARFSMVIDKELYKSMFGFAGMNFVGSLAHILSTQGVSVVLNIFYGVTVNAARGIATQVQNAVTRFVNDFMTALNPQITKEYASGNRWKSMELCFRGAKFSFYLMLIFTLPILVRDVEILNLWLGEYPDYTVEFLRLTIFIALLGVLSAPLVTVLMASGNLTRTTWWIGGTRLLVLPLVYLVFKMHQEPIYAYVIVLGMDVIMLFVRLIIMGSITGMPFLKTFCKDVLPAISIVTLGGFCLVYGLNLIITHTVIGLILFGASSVVGVCMVVFTTGLARSERVAIFGYVKNKLNYL